MYKTSAFFIKGQLPSLTIAELLSFYERELQEQGVDNTNTGIDTITFAIDASASFFYRGSNRFSHFSHGLIQIEETDTDFLVCLQADMTNILIAPGVFAGIATILFLFAAGFSLLPLAVGLGIFALTALISYISISIFFPVYFISLRNGIEREIQSRQG